MMTELEHHLLNTLQNFENSFKEQLKNSNSEHETLENAFKSILHMQQGLQTYFERTSKDHQRLQEQVITLSNQVNRLIEYLNRS